MSEEKSYGQILWEITYPTAVWKWPELEKLLQEDLERRAQTVISEFLRRNGKGCGMVRSKQDDNE
jgi:hypothetical protein